MTWLSDTLASSPAQFYGIVAAFGLTISLWLMGVYLWLMRNNRKEQQLNRRLGLESPEAKSTRREIYLWVDGRVASTSVPGISPQRFRGKLQRLIEKAGWKSSPASVVLSALAILILGGLAAKLWSGSLVITGMALLGLAYGLYSYAEGCIARQGAKFESQMVDALGLATRSLRAGHPLIGAFQLVAQEMEPPISHIFGEICQQQELGLGLEEALNSTVRRVNNDDLKFFSTAVVIQLRSGGNLADMMERLTQVIRERMRLARRARTLTAQTNLSKNVLIAMPFLLFLMIRTLRPEFAAKLTDTEAGRMMVGMACLSMMIGAWVMKRIATLRY